MFAVTIWDKHTVNGFTVLAFDLHDILIEVEDVLPGSLWHLEFEPDAIGQAAQELEAWFASGTRLPGKDALRLSKGIDQTLEGKFVGEKNNQFWLSIESIRGVEFVIVTSEAEIIARLKNRFLDVQDSPEDTDWYDNPPSN